MAMKMDSLSRKSSAFARYLRSRRAVSVYKGALAYILGFILIFLRGFDKLNAFPNTFTSMTILLLVGGPGKSIGACIQSTGLALLGVACGSVCFIALAKLHGSPVAQGFVFAAIVYVFALVKARGLKWFAFALLAILMAFNGIYTSFIDNGFSHRNLVEYIVVYYWAAAIVLAVNFCVFPVTSEKELRRTLILSLEHIATFSHLLSKGYTMEITEEERVVREHLAQSIRADFSFLIQKIEETSIEVNFSKFSMSDYQSFVTRTRGMQLALITAYSSLVNLEKKDTELFMTRFLPNTIKSFNQFRGALNTTMREISVELGVRPLVLPATSAGYAEFMDIERQPSNNNLGLRRQTTASSSGADSVDERLNNVSRRLAEEFGEDDIADSPVEPHHESLAAAPPQSRAQLAASHTPARSSTVGAHTLTAVDGKRTNGSETHAPAATDKQTQPPNQQPRHGRSPGFCIRSLRRVYDCFCADQHDILVECLLDGNLHGADDSLRLGDPLPSLQDLYQYKYVPSSDADHEKPRVRNRRTRRDWMDSEGYESGYVTPIPSTPVTDKDEKKKGDVYYEMIRERTHLEKKRDRVATASHHSLTRVYSFLFAMEQFVTELEVLYHSSKRVCKRKLHIHLFESLQRPHKKSSRARHYASDPPPVASSVSEFPSPGEEPNEDSRELSVAEALALLERRPYTKVKPNIWQRLEKIEQWFRGPTSIFAAKTAAAASIFAVLILHPVPRPWFISFGLTGGALTIVTALTPTLGQSIFTFLLQIMGSGFGYIWALILLEAFRNVGGHHFNPYGIAVLLVPYALALMYVFYEMPQYFVAALLALNGTGTVLIVEWINVEYLGHTTFDSPALRFGKAFTTLGVALALAGIFQLFILRNPARRTLRKRTGTMLFSLLSYATLLQAFARAAMPTDPTHRAPDVAIKRVAEELRHRELKIQSELISLRPLVGFAAAEPQFSRPFRADIVNKILRTSQILLDRMRESRTAISTQPLPDDVLTNFVQILSPYRRRNMQLIQLAFYLVASSITAKSPLLRETPAELESSGHTANFMHDILVLASRHARTEEGVKTIRSGSFTRYFHYLVGITSLTEHLKTLEDACKDLNGEMEDHLA